MMDDEDDDMEDGMDDDDDDEDDGMMEEDEDEEEEEMPGEVCPGRYCSSSSSSSSAGLAALCACIQRWDLRNSASPQPLCAVQRPGPLCTALVCMTCCSTANTRVVPHASQELGWARPVL